MQEENIVGDLMKRIISVLMFIVVLCGCSQKYPEYLSEAKIQELRQEYPYYDGMHPLICMTSPQLMNYIEQCDAYVVGHFTDVGYPDYDKSWRYYPGTFVIEKVIYDMETELAAGDESIVRMPDYEYEYGMELPNDYIYLLPLSATDGEYASWRYGWCYVTPDEYILSVTTIGDLDDYSGWSLEEFADEITSL